MKAIIIQSIKKEIANLEELLQTIKEAQKEFPADEGLIFMLKQYQGRKKRLRAELHKRSENIAKRLVGKLSLPQEASVHAETLELARALRESLRRTSKTSKV